MSMFHELMMRKKEEIMYATINGTLTENDGVFSGFSQRNYLITQNAFPLQPAKFEIFIKIKNTATDNNERYFVGGRLRTSFIIGITKVSANTFTFKLYGGNADGTGAGWNKTSSQITIDETQFFDVKFSYDGSEYALYVNGIKIISYLSTTRLYGNTPIYLGKWDTDNTNVFVGEIDLNKSYIKLGSTKYNLQAVVGYTVVGSPTITDGVVSGFSGIDYMQIPNPKIDNTPFEFFVSFTMGNDMTGQQNLLTENNLNMRLYKLTSDSCFKFRFYDKNTSDNLVVTLDYTIQADTSYKYKVRYNNSILVIAIYDNTNNLLAENSISNVSPLINDQIKIGSLGTSNGYLKGSIDLNNTYIKINNKLWFNGQ